jgi:protein-S-isoprenylcysteine O-methyltransferase Ste14
MLLLRLYLFAGLVLHKLVWEFLRHRSDEKPVESTSTALSAIKAVKVAILLGVIVQTMLPEILPISDDPFVLRIIGTSIYSLGLLTAIAARFQLGENWANIETGQVLRKQNVVARGVYQYIRHPIYVGDLLLLFGLEMALNSWLVAGVAMLVPVVAWKAIKEERMLGDSLPGYDAYCGRTKRFIPFVV